MDTAVSCRDGPDLRGRGLLNEDRLSVHGDRGADMAGDAMQCLPDFKLVRTVRLQDEVLFTLHDDLGVRQFFKADPRMRVF